MSLFAVDSSILTAPAPAPPKAAALASIAAPPAAAVAPSPATTPRAASAAADASDAWRAILPHLTDAALARGHVRAAALMHESATRRIDAGDPSMEAARAMLDACSATDALMQRRQIAGEMTAVPSRTDRTPGTPRFLIGLQWDEITHPAVQAFVQDEITDGAQAEYRNFLDETLRDRDMLLDLDAGVGVGVFTALSPLTATPRDVTVRAWCADTTLRDLLQRNLDAVTLAAGATLAVGVPDPREFVTSPKHGRVIMHLGAQSVTAVGALAPLAKRSVAIAFAITNHAADAHTAHAHDAHAAFEDAGFECFVLALGDEGIELSPLRDVDAAANAGAGYGFALSPAFMTSLGDGHA